MSHQDDGQDDEVLRRLQAAFPPGARIDSRRRAETWRLVLAAARAQRADVGFPDSLFTWLTAGLVLMAAWLAVRPGPFAAPMGRWLPAAVTAAVAANIVCLPVAALVIVRRKHAWHAPTPIQTTPEPPSR